ncbi:MAG: site-specific DNA-methyltransferase [Bacteroidetes bacterium]|nr:site-specific DNA-methyltransferase [Bacteroidota bacterium]
MATVTNVNDAQSPDQFLIRSEGTLKSSHPTVKAQKLMRYLCRLITPPGGIVLDPFMGSGSTGMAAKSEGFEFIGIEKEDEYFSISEKRIAATISN